MQEDKDAKVIIQQNDRLQNIIDDCANISSIKDSKAATLEEAKYQLTLLRSERIKAETHESTLRAAVQELKQKGSDISNVLLAIKKENGRISLSSTSFGSPFPKGVYVR